MSTSNACRPDFVRLINILSLTDCTVGLSYSERTVRQIDWTVKLVESLIESTASNIFFFGISLLDKSWDLNINLIYYL